MATSLYHFSSSSHGIPLFPHRGIKLFLFSLFLPSCFVCRSCPFVLLFDFASLSLIIVYSMSFSVFLRFLSVYFTPQCCFGSADLHRLSVLRGFAVKILGSEQQLLRQL